MKDTAKLIISQQGSRCDCGIDPALFDKLKTESESPSEYAFPMGFHPEGNSADQCGGLTMRDYFASKALPMANSEEKNEKAHYETPTMLGAAKRAYKWADAMIEARKL